MKQKIKNNYNTDDLELNKNNTIIIVDWDDTLFPTSWTVVNGIDLTNPNLRYKYMKYFEKLDKNLNLVIKHMKQQGDVVIVTNAMPEWVELTLSVLPKTKLTMENIEIISAREKYQNKEKHTEWKKYTFIELLDRLSRKKKYKNILSLGDADYEYNALINLYGLKTIPHKYLKTIRFIRTTNYDILMDQHQLIKNNIGNICKMSRHLDVVIETQE